MASILNLKAVNVYVVFPFFWMENLHTVLDYHGEVDQRRRNTSEYVRQSSMSETWVVSINLKDPYFHIPVAREHTKYLYFAYNGKTHSFQVLLFCPYTAPRVFTRIAHEGNSPQGIGSGH